MKIKQVEELVGITKKNIRFYESQGLLDVERAENGYREYHKEDIVRLQEIKLFRKMDLSIEEMKALFEKKKSLQICLEQHLKELEYRKEGLTKMQDICERLISEHQSLETLNAEECLEEIEQMEKEGAKFMNVNKMDVHKKKERCNHWGSGYDCTYGTYHWIYAVGKFAGPNTIWASGIFNCNTCGIDNWTLDCTCRQNERD